MRSGIHNYSSYVNSANEKDPVQLDNMTLDQLNAIVKRQAMSNQERMADAIRRADSASFLVSNPWFKQTKTNFKLVEQWLESKGISQPTYPEFAEATEELAQTGLLDIDEAARTRASGRRGSKGSLLALTQSGSITVLTK